MFSVDKIRVIGVGWGTTRKKAKQAAAFDFHHEYYKAYQSYMHTIRTGEFSDDMSDQDWYHWKKYCCRSTINCFELFLNYSWRRNI